MPSEQYTQTSRGLEPKRSAQTGESSQLEVAGYPESQGFASKEDFLRWINGCIVLDLGSGFGTLAKEVALEKIKNKDQGGFMLDPATTILSLNPELADPVFQKNVHKNKTKGKKGVYSSLYPGTRAALQLHGRRLAAYINEKHDAHSIATTWEHTNLPNESVDKIVANFSFPLYAKSGQEANNVLAEAMRVLRPGGEFRCNLPGIGGDNPNRSFNDEQYYQRLVDRAEEIGFSVEVVAPREEDVDSWSWTAPKAIALHKPPHPPLPDPGYKARWVKKLG